MAEFVDMQNDVVREIAWIQDDVCIELWHTSMGFDTFITWHKETGWDTRRTVRLVEGASAEEAIDAWLLEYIL